MEEYHIPVVTFTSDVEDTKRLCFVGQNGVQCGRAAAGLMGELTGERGKLPLSLVTGPILLLAVVCRGFGLR